MLQSSFLCASPKTVALAIFSYIQADSYTLEELNRSETLGPKSGNPTAG